MKKLLIVVSFLIVAVLSSYGQLGTTFPPASKYTQLVSGQWNRGYFKAFNIAPGGATPTFPADVWQQSGLFWMDSVNNRVGYLSNGTWYWFATAAGSNVTSVGLAMPPAFTVTNSPVTGAGTLTATAHGTSFQYIKGNGTLGALDSAIQVVGDTVYSQLDHTHIFADITDGTQAVRNLFGAGSGITYNNLTGIISAVPGSGDDNFNIGAGYRLLHEPTQQIRTLNAGVGILLDSNAVSNEMQINADTAFLATLFDLGTVDGNKVDSVTFNSGINTDTVLYWINGSFYEAGIIDQRCGLILPGTVVHDSLLVFSVSPSVYKSCCDGTRFTTPLTSVTLSAADPSDDRIDVIALEDGAVVVVEGDPAATPAKPQLSDCQTELTFIYVPAGSTVPGGPTTIDTLLIYDQNVEWGVTFVNVTGDADNFTAPYHYTKAVSVGAIISLSKVKFTSSSSYSKSNYQSLRFFVKLKSTFSNTTRLQVTFYNVGEAVSNTVTIGSGSYGFDRTNTGYQEIIIPMSDFSFSQDAFTAVWFGNTGTNANGYYLDWIMLTGGIIQAPVQHPNSFGVVATQSGNAVSTQPNDVVTFVGAGGVTTSASGKTVTITGGGGTVTGTGVANRIAYWNGASSLTSSANNTFDGLLQTIAANSLGTTQDESKGLLLENTTGAADGSQQISPAIEWRGHGWRTSGSSSKNVEFRAFVEPTQGTPTGTWKLQSSIDNATFGNVITIDNNGSLVATASITANSSLIGMAGEFQVSPAVISSIWLPFSGAYNTGDIDLYHNTSRTLGAGRFGSLNYFNGSITESSSGINPLTSLVHLVRPTIINGAGSHDYAATLYIDGSPVGQPATLGNYAMFIDSGIVRIDDIPYNSGASMVGVVQDTLTGILYRKTVSGSTPLRFGKSGEDATGGENRKFNSNDFDFQIDSAARYNFYTNTVSNRQGQYDLEPSFFQAQIKRNDLANTWAGYYATINGSGVPRLEYFAREAAQDRSNWIQMRSTEIVFESETIAGATRRDYDFRIQHLSGKSSLNATDSLVLADETNGRLWKIAATDIGIGGTPTLQQVFDQETGEALMNKADTINLAANKMSVRGGQFFVDTLSATHIYDTNKDIIIGLVPAGAGSGDEYFEVNNANSGGEVLVGVNGGSGNINFGFYYRGLAAFQFYGTTSTEARLRLFEDRDNGLDYAELKAPANISAGAISLTMPQLAGTLATGTQGTDRASSSTIALTADGNVFEVTGTASVSRIQVGVKENGFELTLIFTSTATLVDGTANSGSDIGFELNGNTDFSATADDTITLVLCEIGGTQRWREKCRSVN